MGYKKEVTKSRRPLSRKPLNPIQEENITEHDKLSTVLLENNTQQPEPVYFAEPINCKSTIGCQTDNVIVSTPITKSDATTQTYDEVLEHNYADILKQYCTKSISTQATCAELSADSIETNVDSIFYTGLTLLVYPTLLTTLEKYGNTLPYKLSVKDQILLTLIRLRQALPLKDLSRRFGISMSLASSIFNSWIDIMAKHLKGTIAWLSRDTIRRTLPKAFKESYPKTTVIVDCTEIFIQRPFSLKARSQTYSSYKSHSTAKLLVAIAPNGYIMFLSLTYGGRASDRFITKSCGILNYLEPGDEVMADRGFTISEELYSLRVKLNIPSFMRGRQQLTDEETTESRRIAAVRIHVERVIARLKSYKLLNSTMQIPLMKNIDKIVIVCAALCNLRGPLIKEETE